MGVTFRCARDAFHRKKRRSPQGVALNTVPEIRAAFAGLVMRTSKRRENLHSKSGISHECYEATSKSFPSLCLATSRNGEFRVLIPGYCHINLNAPCGRFDRCGPGRGACVSGPLLRLLPRHLQDSFDKVHPCYLALNVKSFEFT